MFMLSIMLFAGGLIAGLSVQVAVGQEPSIRGLNHGVIAVDDVEAASRFYPDILGFPEAFAFRQAGQHCLSFRSTATRS